ncbi:NAD(P)H-dependent oxidoreductase subunit E [Shigella flexneri]
MHHYEDPRAASIEALKSFRSSVAGCRRAIAAIADVLGTPASDVEAWQPFYSQLPSARGRHVIRYCDSVVCHINGYQGIQAALEKKLNIKPGKRISWPLYVTADFCLGTAIKGQT